MNEYEIEKKAQKGTLKQEDLNDCSIEVLQKALLIISSKVAVLKMFQKNFE